METYDSIIIFTYTWKKNGIRMNQSEPVPALIEYFTKKTDNFFLLENPLPLSKNNIPTLSYYYQNKFIKEYLFPN